MSIKYLFNDSGSEKTYEGVPIADQAFYQIPTGMLPNYENNNTLRTDITNSDILMSMDGVAKITDPVIGLNFLLSVHNIHPDTGANTISTKKLKDGYYYQYREIAFETSKLNTVHDKDKARVDLGCTTVKYLDSSRSELVSPSQATLDSSCHYTVIKFQPPTDWGIRAAEISHKSATSNNIYMNVDVNILVDPAPVYLTLPQSNGGLDLYFLPAGGRRGVSDENFTYFTSNDYLEFDIDHGAAGNGINHEVQVIMELALPIPT